MSKRLLCGIKYQFRVRVPLNIFESYLLYKDNGNTIWSNAIQGESKLLQYDINCFSVVGYYEITDQHQYIPLLWTFPVKFSGHHHSCLRAMGHRMINLEIEYYSGIFELYKILILFVIVVLK